MKSDHPRGRLRDPAPAADRRRAEAAAPGRRPADARLGARRVREVDEVDEVYVVTNAGSPGLRALGAGEASPSTTTGRLERRSARRDRRHRLVIERAGLDDDELLVVAGDNLFELSLPGFAALWREKRSRRAQSPCTTWATRAATHTASSTIDDDDRIVGFVEKPRTRPRRWPRHAIYSTTASTAPRPAGTSTRATARPAGSLVGWLAHAGAGLRLPRAGEWYDIGDTRSCSRPTTGCGGTPASPSARLQIRPSRHIASHFAA